MEDKLDLRQIKFHCDKVLHLEKEWENRKLAGEKRILKMENELRMELERLQKQIDSHRQKAGDIRIKDSQPQANPQSIQGN
jgi:hypothetical protein